MVNDYILNFTAQLLADVSSQNATLHNQNCLIELARKCHMFFIVMFDAI